MKSKKSQEHSEFIRIALIVIIIIVCVYLVWHFILAKNAVARTFAMDIAKSAGISVEKEDRYSALAKEVAGILNMPDSKSAQSAYDAVKAKLTAEMKNVKPDEQYLLDRLVELNHNADANIAYMKIAPDFWNLKYNGVDDPSKFISDMNNFKPRFEEVAKDYAGTVAAGEAQGQINLIAGISDCTRLDPSSGSCTPQATKNLCVVYFKGDPPNPNEMVCAVARCADANAKISTDPDFCNRLASHSKTCVPRIDRIGSTEGSIVRNCVPCIDIKKEGCAFYGQEYVNLKGSYIAGDACQANVCEVEGGCVKKWIDLSSGLNQPKSTLYLGGVYLSCMNDCPSLGKEQCAKWSRFCNWDGSANKCDFKKEWLCANCPQ